MNHRHKIHNVESTHPNWKIIIDPPLPSSNCILLLFTNLNITLKGIIFDIMLLSWVASHNLARLHLQLSHAHPHAQPTARCAPKLHNTSLPICCVEWLFPWEMGVRTQRASMQGQLDPQNRVRREVLSVMKYKVWKSTKFWPFSKWGHGLAPGQIPLLCFDLDLDFDFLTHPFKPGTNSMLCSWNPSTP